jgi:hypothetical protein
MEVAIVTALAAAFAAGIGYAIGRTGRSGRADIEAASARWQAAALEDAIQAHAPEAWGAIRAHVLDRTRSGPT